MPPVSVRIAEYEPLFSPDPEVNDPSPMEKRGSTPFRAEATARLSAVKYTLSPAILSFSIHLSGNVYPTVTLLMLR